MRALEPDSRVAIGRCLAADYHPEDTALRGYDAEYAFFVRYEEREEQDVVNVPARSVDPDTFAGQEIPVSAFPDGSYQTV